jgi:hypothetical protein
MRRGFGLRRRRGRWLERFLTRELFVFRQKTDLASYLLLLLLVSPSPRLLLLPVEQVLFGPLLLG